MPFKSEALKLTKTCQSCTKDFQVYKSSVSKAHPAKYCSKSCVNEAKKKRNTKVKVCGDLFDQGLTIKEIALKTSFPMGTVAACLNRHQYRRGPGQSWTTAKIKFKKNKCCEICGFTRALDTAHIIPAAKGGSYEEYNLLVLCPNHHRLFDQNKLDTTEYSKIKDKVEKARGYSLAI